MTPAEAWENVLVEQKFEELVALSGPFLQPWTLGMLKAVAVMLVRLEERVEKLEGKK